MRRCRGSRGQAGHIASAFRMQKVVWHRSHPLKASQPSQMAPPARDQVLNMLVWRGAFHIYTTESCKHECLGES